MNVLQWARGQWDRVTAWILITLGALALILGWLGVRTEPLTQKQIPYIISGGIGGVLLVGVGAMLWLSADLRDEWRKLDAIERAMSSTPEPAADDPFVADPFVDEPIVDEPMADSAPAAVARRPLRAKPNSRS